MIPNEESAAAFGIPTSQILFSLFEALPIVIRVTPEREAEGLVACREQYT